MSNFETPPKKRRWVLPVVLLATFLVLTGCCLGGLALTSRGVDSADVDVTTTATVGSDADNEPNPTPSAAKKGEGVRDGKFEFTVKSLACGRVKVGPQYFTKTAQGKFCLVGFTVKNIGNEAQLLDTSSQFAYSPDNKKFSTDSEATISFSDGNGRLFENINPGNKVEGTLVFDIPAGETINRLELHDSAWSNGVFVKLK